MAGPKKSEPHDEPYVYHDTVMVLPPPPPPIGGGVGEPPEPSVSTT